MYALMLTEVEREHLFLIALGRPPAPTQQITEGITPRLQKVLDSFEFSPAVVRNRMWDVVAWNRAATLIMAPYEHVADTERNIVRMMFCNSEVRNAQLDWQAVARYVVAAFRADAARAGIDVTNFVDELSRVSPEFQTMWAENNVVAHGEGSKQIRHPKLGLLNLEFSGFVVDGRPDLTLTVWTPATELDKQRIIDHLS
jgi:hypothetical protein